MTYLLDTNICIDHLRKRGTGILRRKLAVVSPVEIALCSVVVAELYVGALSVTRSSEAMAEVKDFCRLFRSLPFDDAAAEHWARVHLSLSKRGLPIGQNDLFIASIALAHRLTVATRNVEEFRRVDGLNVESWSA